MNFDLSMLKKAPYRNPLIGAGVGLGAGMAYNLFAPDGYDINPLATAFLGGGIGMYRDMGMNTPIPIGSERIVTRGKATPRTQRVSVADPNELLEETIQQIVAPSAPEIPVTIGPYIDPSPRKGTAPIGSYHTAVNSGITGTGGAPDTQAATVKGRLFADADIDPSSSPAYLEQFAGIPSPETQAKRALLEGELSKASPRFALTSVGYSPEDASLYDDGVYSFMSAPGAHRPVTKAGTPYKSAPMAKHYERTAIYGDMLSGLDGNQEQAKAFASGLQDQYVKNIEAQPYIQYIRALHGL